MRHFMTAALERHREYVGEFQTEPYETAWASEAIFFLRVEKIEGVDARLSAGPGCQLALVASGTRKWSAMWIRSAALVEGWVYGEVRTQLSLVSSNTFFCGGKASGASRLPTVTS